MLRLPLFIVAPQIVDLFGEGGVRSLLAETFGTYTCAVCGRTGNLDTDSPAAVLLTIYDLGMGQLHLRLAHPECSRSTVTLSPHSPTPTGQLHLPALAWLRAGDPPAVVVIGPRVSARTVVGGGDLTDVILSGFLAAGFTLLTAPDTPLPAVHSTLDVAFGPDQHLTITNADGNTLYDGTLQPPDGWAELIDHTGTLGVVVARGLDLRDPDRDHVDDLHAAIARGAAVGIAVRIDPHVHQKAIAPSERDELDHEQAGRSLGASPGGSLVRETPSETPPDTHPTTQVNPPDRPTGQRGD